MTPQPTVYLIAQPTIKKNGRLPVLTPLHAHGAVKQVLHADARASRTPQSVLDRLRAELHAFNPTCDFLAWAGGDTLAAVLSGIVLAERGIRSFTWLRYDRVRLNTGEWTDTGAHYRPVLVTL